jgi:hypothetical protein
MIVPMTERDPAPTDAAPTDSAPTDSALTDVTLADAMTSLWRAGRKLEGAGEAAGRQAARHLRAATETLAAAGVTVQAHDGRAFDPGLALEVVAYEPRPGTTRETVLETVRPCVYRSGRRIQVGQVIVGTP